MMYYGVSYWTGEFWMPEQIMDAEQLEAFIYVLCDEDEFIVKRHQDLIDAVANGEFINGYTSSLISVNTYGKDEE